MEILILVSKWLLPFIVGLLTILGIFGVKKALDYFGVKRSEKVDDLIDRYVRMAINAAEVVGRKYLETQGAKLAGSSKKAKAVNTVLKELEQSGIKDVAEGLISDRIEHWLEQDGYKPGIPSDPQNGESV